MVDAFGGSGTVCLNVPFENKIYNELEPNTFAYMKTLLAQDAKSTHAKVQAIIREFDLSRRNEEGYQKLKDLANKTKDPFLFYVLHRHSFSNLSRFNDKGEFTVQFGNRSCGSSRKEFRELNTFWLRMKNTKLTNMHYAELLGKLKKVGKLDSKTFIYFDPPYLASGKQSSYAEWSHDEDIKLRHNMNKLTKMGVKWMMSNVFAHKTYENPELREWAKKYEVIDMKAVYRFSRQTEKPPEEVLIINYPTSKRKTKGLHHVGSR